MSVDSEDSLEIGAWVKPHCLTCRTSGCRCRGRHQLLMLRLRREASLSTPPPTHDHWQHCNCCHLTSRPAIWRHSSAFSWLLSPMQLSTASPHLSAIKYRRLCRNDVPQTRQLSLEHSWWGHRRWWLSIEFLSHFWCCPTTMTPLHCAAYETSSTCGFEGRCCSARQLRSTWNRRRQILDNFHDEDVVFFSWGRGQMLNELWTLINLLT